MEVLFAKTETGIRFLHTCVEEQNTTGIWGHNTPVKHGTLLYMSLMHSFKFSLLNIYTSWLWMKTPSSKEIATEHPLCNMASGRPVAPPWLYIEMYTWVHHSLTSIVNIVYNQVNMGASLARVLGLFKNSVLVLLMCLGFWGACFV